MPKIDAPLVQENRKSGTLVVHQICLDEGNLIHLLRARGVDVPDNASFDVSGWGEPLSIEVSWDRFEEDEDATA